MLDTSGLYAAVKRVFTNPVEASTEDLSKACRFCATDEHGDCHHKIVVKMPDGLPFWRIIRIAHLNEAWVRAFVTLIRNQRCLEMEYKKSSLLNFFKHDLEHDNCTQHLNSSLLGLLQISLEGRGDDDSGNFDIRRARLALRTIINGANRCKRFAETVSPRCLTLFRALLRIPEVRTETFAAFLALSRPMRTACGLEDSYSKLLGELFLLWESKDVSDTDRSWISALTSMHLEEDYAFLSSCFADLSSDEFTALLHITDVLMDSSNAETDVTKAHPNNIFFCIDLLELAIYEIADGTTPERRSAYVEQIAYAIEILASAALRGSEFSSRLLDQPIAVTLIADILECVLDAQWLDENIQLNDDMEQICADRPQRVPEIRCSRVCDSFRLSALSAAVRDSSIELRATIKCAAVRAIGNLCCERPSLRLAAGSKGAVLAVLRCARLTDNDRPFIVQWSVAALRYLCLGCPENQKIVLEMDQKPTGVIDRRKLLKELGINVEIDQMTGAVRLIQSSNFDDMP